MTKIRDIVQINSGYTSYVDLAKEYFNLEKNRGRMERYQPITAHRLAFEQMAKALNPKDRRCYFLSGSYGTGKSHLCLMLANYFASPSSVPEMDKFFGNYDAAQRQVLLKPGETLQEKSAAALKAARSSGRFLVAICRFDLNLEFEGTVLRAIEEALRQEAALVELDSHYEEALRRIQSWETAKTERRFFGDLEQELRSHHGEWTVPDLAKGLTERDEAAMKVWRAAFRAVTDNDFTYSKDNLQDIIKDIVANPAFKAQYKGLVIIYDEFGYALDDGLVNLSRLHNFAQFCANSGMEHLPVVFIGTGHKAFRNHGQVGDAIHYNTLQARVEEIALQTQGMEDIIAAIVQPRKQETGWVQEVMPHGGTFTLLSSECKRLGLFNWLPAPKVKNNIIENIYPMHPLATYALLRLAAEAGSDNRSVFKFFSPEFDEGSGGWKNVQPNSYPWFIERHEVIEGHRLALYTADLVVDYFRDGLSVENSRLVDRIKTAVVNYEATLRELNAYIAREDETRLIEESDELMMRILRAILVIEIVNSDQCPIANTSQNICFALDATSAGDRTQVDNRLQVLCQAGIVYNNQGVYELMKGDRKDITRMVDQYKANPQNRPSDVLSAFLELKPLRPEEQFLEAKDYNSTYNEDKRLRVVFATPAMLEMQSVVDGANASYFDRLENDRLAAGRGKNGYEGTAIYAFCETDQSIEQATAAAARNIQRRGLVAVPRSPIVVFDAIFTLQALAAIQKSKEAESFGPYENIQLAELRKKASDLLDDAKASYFSNTSVEWFGMQGTSMAVQDNKRHDAANQLMQSLYQGKRNTFAHSDFNRAHAKVEGQVRSILKEAGDVLSDLSQTVHFNWTLPDNRGGTRYLRKCFVDNQVLRHLSSEGDERYYEAETTIDKFKPLLPSYARMLECLAAFENKEPALVWEFLQQFYEDYGQGEIALTLMLLMARRYYGDSLRFKREQGAMTDLRFDSTDDMLQLVTGQNRSAVILFEPVSAEDRAYFARVRQIFSMEPGAAGKIYGLADAFQAMTGWWTGLATIARSDSFHLVQDRPLLIALNQTKTKDPFNFIKQELPSLMGLLPGEKISAPKLEQIAVRLAAFKEAAEAVRRTVEEQILAGTAKIYGAASSLEVDVSEAIRNWYVDDLTPVQKDPHSTFHNNDSKPLLKISQLGNVRDLLFDTLPTAYGLGAVKGWTTNQTVDFLSKLAAGKEHIEKNAPQISQLKVNFENADAQDGSRVSYSGELRIHADTDDGDGVIYYTDDGSDPADEKSERAALRPGDSLVATGTRKIKLVVADGKGNYGKVTTIEAVDQLDKYKIKRPTQSKWGDEFIQFVFPKDRPAVQITLSSLLREIAKAGTVGQSDLEAMVLEILTALEAKND